MIFNTCSLFNIPPFGSLPEAWKGLFPEGSCESRPKGIHLMESFLFIYRLGNDFDSSKSQLQAAFLKFENVLSPDGSCESRPKDVHLMGSFLFIV